MKCLASLLLLALAVVASASDFSEVESKGALECSVCEAAVSAVQHALENSTRIGTAVENILEAQVCTRLPTCVQELCNSTVADQLPEILASLADKYLDGPTDCTRLHICSKSSLASESGSVACQREFLNFLGNWMATNACNESKLCLAPSPPPNPGSLCCGAGLICDAYTCRDPAGEGFSCGPNCAACGGQPCPH